MTLVLMALAGGRIGEARHPGPMHFFDDADSDGFSDSDDGAPLAPGVDDFPWAQWTDVYALGSTAHAW